MPVRGARETARALRGLAQYVSTPLTTASRFALRPALTKAKQNVRSIPFDEGTGTLARSLTIKKRKGGSKLNPVTQVGPDSSVKVTTEFGVRRPVKYAHILEFGSVGPGAHVVHPTPFLTPAYLDTRDQVVKRFGERIGPEMEKRAAKLRAKAK